MKAARFIVLWLAAAFACFAVEAIVIAIWRIYMAGHSRTSPLNEERVFPLIGPSTPLDVIAVLSSLLIGLVLAIFVRSRRKS